jgi:hypothetical protein
MFYKVRLSPICGCVTLIIITDGEEAELMLCRDVIGELVHFLDLAPSRVANSLSTRRDYLYILSLSSRSIYLSCLSFCFLMMDE